MPRQNKFSKEEMKDMICVYSKEDCVDVLQQNGFLHYIPIGASQDTNYLKILDRLDKTGSINPKSNHGRSKIILVEQEKQI